MGESAISYNLRRLRIAKGFTKKHLAEAANLSRPAYSSIENGKVGPRVSNLQKIADALGVGIQDIVAPVPHVSSLRFRSFKTLTRKEQSKRDQIVNDVAVWLRVSQACGLLLRRSPHAGSRYIRGRILYKRAYRRRTDKKIRPGNRVKPLLICFPVPRNKIE